jgi:hypothetical protein
MKQLPIFTVILAGFFLAACTQKTPQFVNSIPDNVVAVVSLHPMQIHSKGKLNSFEALKEKAKDEVWSMILEDPLSSGLMLDEYTYLFAWIEKEAPVIGMVSGMKDMHKFESVLKKIDDDIPGKATELEGYKFIQPDPVGIIAWNEEQVIILGSPDKEEFEQIFWTGTLDKMFHPMKEESVTSLVDFKDFQGKMKDINLWLSTDNLREIVEKIAGDKIGELPFSLHNNYTHFYCDFAEGEMNLTSEVNFSEEVQKNLDEILVLKPSLNDNILKMTPGGHLLLAMSVSMDLEKVQKLMEKIPTDSLHLPEGPGEVIKNIEEALGMDLETVVKAFTGDFTLAVNGIEGDATIPLEIFIGVGMKSDEIQKQMMKKMGEMVPIEEEGDFFMINIQGNEIYSGIIRDTWVITNAKGYKEAAIAGKLDKSLLNSKFSDYAGGSMGLYLNLDLDAYPSFVRDLAKQHDNREYWIRQVTDPLDHFGITAGDRKGLMTLKTNNPHENSLYTLLKITESGE